MSSRGGPAPTILALDTEGPKFDKKEVWRGNAYGDSRSLVAYSCADHEEAWAVQWGEYSVDELDTEISCADLVVGFNFKHDITWLRKCGVDLSKIKKLWDVQLAEFVLSRQTKKFPSLDETCEKYGIPKKYDVVKEEYWNKGIDTCDVPWNILSEYAAHDADVTLQCYHAQLPLLTPAQKILVSLMSQDLLILQEMEWNGITFDEELCYEESILIDNQISEIQNKLASIYPDIPINFGSPDQLSSFLYGGTIIEATKVHDGFFKTGKKAGEPKYRNVDVVHQLPRLYTPLKGTEMDKEGKWSTAEPTLKKLKGKKHILDMLLSLAKLDKLNGTYYKGLPLLRQSMQWSKGKLHGQLNQTLAGTGRLSSSKPNQQNFASELQHIFISEFD